jgi:REP element-mobilizing transposase RayT
MPLAKMRRVCENGRRPSLYNAARQPLAEDFFLLQVYIELMAEWCGRYGVAFYAYCLMPNHVHFSMVPESDDGLRRVTTKV